MSINTPDAGNVGITSSGGIAVATTASGFAGWLNENAMLIGLGLSVVSLLIGVVFKIMAGIRAERHHKERMEAEAKQNAQALEAMRAEIRDQLRSTPANTSSK